MTCSARQSGFALIMVLWTLALLTTIGVQLASSGRREAQLTRNLMDSAVLQAAADGAVQQAIFRLLDSSERQWRADGTFHLMRLGHSLVRVRIEDESGKVNPNIASAELLPALLLEASTPPPLAPGLAAASVAWRSAAGGPTARSTITAQYASAGRDYRPPGAPFESIDELGAVLGMTPELLARLSPHMTIFTEEDPDASTTDPVVAAALAAVSNGTLAAGQPTGRSAVLVTRVTAVAQGPHGAVVAERVIVRTNALGGNRRYEILSREQGVSSF